MTERSTLARRLPWILACVVTAVALGVLADVVGDATQTRPENTLAGETTVLEMRVSTNQYEGDLDEAALAAWSACSGHVEGRAEVHHVADDRYEVRISPGAGRQARHRVEGCIEDANTERVRAYALSIGNVPNLASTPTSASAASRPTEP